MRVQDHDRAVRRPIWSHGRPACSVVDAKHPACTIGLSINGTALEITFAAGFEEARMMICWNITNLWNLHLSGRERRFKIGPRPTGAQGGAG